MMNNFKYEMFHSKKDSYCVIGISDIGTGIEKTDHRVDIIIKDNNSEFIEQVHCMKTYSKETTPEVAICDLVNHLLNKFFQLK